jgi:hypothetical protein
VCLPLSAAISRQTSACIGRGESFELTNEWNEFSASFIISRINPEKIHSPEK